MHRFDDLAACTDALPDVALGCFDLARIVYTSGTESTPKGAMLTHDTVLWQYVSCVINAEIAEANRALHALPQYHCAQLDVFFGPAIYIGRSNVITSKPTPDNLLALIEVNPHHPSLRQHALSGKWQGLHSVSINLPYRITLELLIQDQQFIAVHVGDHDAVY